MRYTRLWLLRPIGSVCDKHDMLQGAVVRAVSELGARMFAADEAGDEGKDVWLDHTRSTCIRLEHEGVEGTVMLDFLNG